jgi:formylglycine-generating enzyme required for sulfatase activity
MISLSPVIQQLIDNMIHVDGGTFMMGTNLEEDHECNTDDEHPASMARPAHQVTLSSFSIGRYEVTLEEWLTIMGGSPIDLKNGKLPVRRVNWRDCQSFIKKLNKLTGMNFRLPTEAEWEFAARGGNESHGYKYSGSDCLDDVAWYSVNCVDDEAESLEDGTHEVGKKSPNELGLYDMSGNVMEWCQDRYGEYGCEAQVDPQGPSSTFFKSLYSSSGACRVLRGGSWINFDKGCTVTIRHFSAPGLRHAVVGMRLAYSYP